MAELGTEGSIDGNSRLVLRGKYVPKGIEVRHRVLCIKLWVGLWGGRVCVFVGAPSFDNRRGPKKNTQTVNPPPTPLRTPPPTTRKQSLLRKYIGEYVACTTCKSPNTALRSVPLPLPPLCLCVCMDGYIHKYMYVYNTSFPPPTQPPHTPLPTKHAHSRDSVSRLYFVHCQSCGSSRSVAPIRTGFHAQTRADRRALRK